MLIRPEDVGPDPDPAWAGAEEELGDFARHALGDHAGLTQFGVALEVLAPGSRSSDRHWHAAQDEFLYLIPGEAMLVEDAGARLMRPGDCAAWTAGEPNGHHLVNRSDAPCSFLVVGSRTPTDAVHYSEIDRITYHENGRTRMTRRDGTPIDPETGESK